MRIRTYAALVSLLAVGLFAMGPAVACAAMPGWPVLQLTNGTFAHTPTEPIISGNHVVWTQSDDANHSQVMLWTAGDSAPTTITASSTGCGQPVISGNRMAWMEWTGTYYQVWTQTIGGLPRRMDNDSYAKGALALDGDRLVWLESVGAYWQIVTRDAVLGSQPDQVTTNALSHTPASASGDRLVWSEYDGAHYQIWAYSGLTGQKGKLTTDPVNHLSPVVSGSRYAWLVGGTSSGQVVTWRPGEATVTASVSTDCVGVQISGDRLAWLGVDGGSDRQVFTWTPGQGQRRLTSESRGHGGLGVSGDRVTWSSDYGAGTSIPYTWRAPASSPSPLAGAPSYFAYLHASGDRIVWQDHASGDPSQTFTTAATTTTLSKLAISPSKRKKGRKLTFSAVLAPGGAGAGGVTLTLARWEKKKGSKAYYWHVRKTLTLKASTAGSTKVKASTKLAYKGKWKAVAVYNGWSGYLPSNTLSKTFKVN